MGKCEGCSDTKKSEYFTLKIVFSTPKKCGIFLLGDPLADVFGSLLLRQQAFPFKPNQLLPRQPPLKQDGRADELPGYQTQPWQNWF